MKKKTIQEKPQALIIKSDRNTPNVVFDPNNGSLEIKGRSLPSNPPLFYKKLNSWIKAYSEFPNKHTTLNINVEYFNNSSSKCIVELLKQLENLESKSEVTVNFYCDKDDSDMLDTGDYFKSTTKVPFSTIDA